MYALLNSHTSRVHKYYWKQAESLSWAVSGHLTLTAHLHKHTHSQLQTPVKKKPIYDDHHDSHHHHQRRSLTYSHCADWANTLSFASFLANQNCVQKKIEDEQKNKKKKAKHENENKFEMEKWQSYDLQCWVELYVGVSNCHGSSLARWSADPVCGSDWVCYAVLANG